MWCYRWYTRLTTVPLKCYRYHAITFSSKSKYINKSNYYNYYYIHNNIISIALYSTDVYMFKKVLRLLNMRFFVVIVTRYIIIII